MPITALSVNKRAGRPSVKFTPEYFRYTYDQFREGSFKPLIEMMNQAEMDSHVAGCLVGRRAGIMVDYSISPYDPDNTQDQERAEWFRGVLDRLKIRSLLREIQKAIFKKFSVIDFEWEMIDGRWVPVSFKSWEQKYFKYKDGILGVDQGREIGEIPDTTLVCEYDDTPVMMPVLRDFILKTFGLEVWASFMERFGEPFLIGWYPSGSEQKNIDELNTALANLARSAHAAIPDFRTSTGDKSIDIVATTKTTGDHEKFENRCNKGIAISTLGHANAVESSTGSMQVGENLTQYKVRRDIAVDDMYFCDENMFRLTKIVWKLNFGDQRYARWALDKKEPVNVAQMSGVVDMAWRHGVEITPENYRNLGLKLSEDQGPVKKDPSVLSY